MKRYFIDSIENMRDLGGYIVSNQKLRYQKIIRSNLPSKLKQKDIQSLKEMGIKITIDLRSTEEVKNMKSVFENNSYFKLLHYPINGNGKLPATSKDVPISYMKMLDGQTTIYNIFKVLVKEEGVLYFCNAGKDRTGIVTALILMTLGVSKKDIILDYTLSNIYLRDKLKEFEKISDNIEIKEIITPKAEYMEQFLDNFYKKYKTIYHYLHEIGITDEDIQIIKMKYLEDL